MNDHDAQLDLPSRLLLFPIVSIVPEPPAQPIAATPISSRPFASNRPIPPVRGMTAVPLGIDDSFGSWFACVTHAIGESSIRQQFKADTGWDVESVLIRTPIEAFVDKSTGYEAMLMLKFFDWVTVHIWGEEPQPPSRA